MRTARRLLAAVLFVAALVIGWRFADANQAPVSIYYLIGDVAGLPLWGVLLAAFAAGFALAGAVGLYHAARLSLTARRWRKAAGRLEGEIHQLRNLPLAAQPESAPRSSAGAGPLATSNAAGPLEPNARSR